ncbi:MAG: hypothetical protein QOI98_531, partial [Solirubrobacteraceae bacterium]|nr:hypothetical protein [Solirubrobacteraceae bacterium]
MDGEVDGAVNDRAAGPELAGLVVDREHRVLPMLRHDHGERAQPGRSRELAGLLVQRDPAVLLKREQNSALDADLLRVGRGQSVEGVLGVGAEGAEPSGEVGFSVLKASEVGGEACEVAAGGAVVAFGLGLQRAGFALGQSGSEDFLLVGHGVCSPVMGRHLSPEWCGRRLLRRGERPALAPARDEHESGARGREASAQAADVAVDGAVADLPVTPDAPGQLVLAEHPRGLVGELDQQLELQATDVHRGTGDGDGLGGQVDGNRARMQMAHAGLFEDASDQGCDHGAYHDVARSGWEVVVAAALVGAQRAELVAGAERDDRQPWMDARVLAGAHGP